MFNNEKRTELWLLFNRVNIVLQEQNLVNLLLLSIAIQKVLEYTKRILFYLSSPAEPFGFNIETQLKLARTEMLLQN